MLEKTLGQEYADKDARYNFLRDNCDCIEVLDYTKEFLVDKNVQLRDVKADKRAADELYKEQDKGYKNQIKHLESENEDIAKTLKEKAEFVSENCFKFIDDQTGSVGYYDNEGVLRYSRPLTPDERQRTIQMEIRRTGTEG